MDDKNICRYLPFRGTIPNLSPKEYWEWVSRYYEEVCPYPWISDIQEGDLIVIDQAGVNTGLMGSANTLGCLELGTRGLVTNGGVRDTDEIILRLKSAEEIESPSCLVETHKKNLDNFTLLNATWDLILLKDYSTATTLLQDDCEAMAEAIAIITDVKEPNRESPAEAGW